MLWIEDSFADGEGITLVSDTLSGLQHFQPWLRTKLQGSWRLFRIWRKVERPRQTPPLPAVFAQALIARSLELDKWHLAISIALAFWGMLRTGELLALTTANIICGDADLVIQLGFTKTGLRRAVDENVVVDDPPTIYLYKTFRQVLRGRRQFCSPIWNRGAQEFRAEFQELISFFHMPGTIRPYSLRRGGATHDFRVFNHIERTLLKGRWSSTSAARQYIQEGLSELTRLQISASAGRLIQKYAAFFS